MKLRRRQLGSSRAGRSSSVDSPQFIYSWHEPESGAAMAAIGYRPQSMAVR